MKMIKIALSQLTKLIMLLILCTLFWGWIFTFLTDTKLEHKITLFINAELKDETGLALLIEEVLPSDFRMAKVHPFSYAMINGDTLRNADLYIMKTSDLEEYEDWQALPGQINDKEICMPIPVYDETEDIAILNDYIHYQHGEKYYLAFGRSSLHLSSNENAIDNYSKIVVEYLLKH